MSGWAFIGWSQSSDPTAAISYNSIYNLALDSNKTVYATYRKSFQITYSANGGSGSTEPTIGYAYSNSVNVKYPTVTVAGNSFSRSGYTFTGWSSYSVGQSITLSSDITLSAQWKQNNIPYSIVEDWVVQPGIPTIKWVSEKTAVANKWSVGSVYPSVNANGYAYEEQSELQAYIDIPTKGNSSMEIRIDSKATNGDGGKTWVEVNGNRVEGHYGVWSISGLSTVRVRVHAFNWGYSENAFVQFQTWKLY